MTKRQREIMAEQQSNTNTISPYTMRIEYRLCRNNNEYLHIDNLKGSVDDVIKSYTPLLGIIHHNFLADNVDVTANYNKHFNKIVKESSKGNGNKRRYRSGTLKKSGSIPPYPKNTETTEKLKAQEQLEGTFLKAMEDAQKTVISS